MTDWAVVGGDIAVDVDDLLLLSDACAGAARTVATAASCVGSACLRAQSALVASYVRPPGDTGPPPPERRVLLGEVVTAPALLPRVGVDLARLGLRIAHAAHAYEAAEEAALRGSRGLTRRMDVLGTTGGYLARLLGRTPDPGPYRGADPGALPELAAGPLSALYPRRIAEVSTAIELGELTGPGGVEDLLALVDGSTECARGGPPGRLDVLAITVPAGLTVPAGGGTVPAGLTVPAGGGTVPAGLTVPAGAASTGGGTVPAGLTVPAGCAVSTGGGTVPAGLTVPAGCAVSTGGGAVSTDGGTVPGGGGRTVYVVALPGTSDWSPPWSAEGPGDVRSLHANLQLIAGQVSAEVAALPQALAAAGVPPGADVLFVGHSQGGMTAYSAAGDPAVRAAYHVTHVITAGAPVGAMAAPEGVSVLSLENRRDLVPALDGHANLGAAGRVTVLFDGADGRPQHDLGQYAAAARYVDGGPAEGGGAHGLSSYRSSLVEAGYLPGPGAPPARLSRVILAVRDVHEAAGGGGNS